MRQKNILNKFNLTASSETLITSLLSILLAIISAQMHAMEREQVNYHDDETAEEKNKNFSGVCSICNRYQENIIQHTWYTHRSDTKRERCLDCNKLISVNAITQHRYNVHGPGSEHVTCSECGRSVKSYYLQAHQDLHSKKS